MSSQLLFGLAINDDKFEFKMNSVADRDMTILYFQKLINDKKKAAGEDLTFKDFSLSDLDYVDDRVRSSTMSGFFRSGQLSKLELKLAKIDMKLTELPAPAICYQVQSSGLKPKTLSLLPLQQLLTNDLNYHFSQTKSSRDCTGQHSQSIYAQCTNGTAHLYEIGTDHAQLKINRNHSFSVDSKTSEDDQAYLYKQNSQIEREIQPIKTALNTSI